MRHISDAPPGYFDPDLESVQLVTVDPAWPRKRTPAADELPVCSGTLADGRTVVMVGRHVHALDRRDPLAPMRAAAIAQAIADHGVLP